MAFVFTRAVTDLSTSDSEEEVGACNVTETDLSADTDDDTTETEDASVSASVDKNFWTLVNDCWSKDLFNSQVVSNTSDRQIKDNSGSRS